MKIKKRYVSVMVVALSVLLVLALTLGITGAWYKARREATGLIKFDNGIIIDYKGFNDNKTDNFAIWKGKDETIDTSTIYAVKELFTTASFLPGATISLNTASIKANENSLDFYARAKVDFVFYQATATGEYTELTSDELGTFKTSDLFPTIDVLGENWVQSEKDEYSYYSTDATDLTLITKTSDIPLIKENAKLVLAGETYHGINGAYQEQGGFIISETVSIDKVELKLTLEILQGNVNAPEDADWKIGEAVGTITSLQVGKTYSTIYFSQNASDYNLTKLTGSNDLSSSKSEWTDYGLFKGRSSDGTDVTFVVSYYENYGYIRIKCGGETYVSITNSVFDANREEYSLGDGKTITITEIYEPEFVANVFSGELA